MEFSPISQIDLQDKTLDRLNRIIKFLQEQVGRVQGLAGPFTFRDTLRFPQASMPGTDLPPEGEAILNRTQIEKLIPLVVTGDLISRTITIGSGGGGGSPATDDTVKLDGEIVTY